MVLVTLCGRGKLASGLRNFKYDATFDNAEGLNFLLAMIAYDSL